MVVKILYAYDCNEENKYINKLDYKKDSAR